MGNVFNPLLGSNGIDSSLAQESKLALGFDSEVFCLHSRVQEVDVTQLAVHSTAVCMFSSML